MIEGRPSRDRGTRAGALAAGQRVEPDARQPTAALVRLADLGAATRQGDGDVRRAARMTVADVVAASDLLDELGMRSAPVPSG